MKGQITLEFQLLLVFSIFLISFFFSSLILLNTTLLDQKTKISSISNFDSTLLLYQYRLLSSLNFSVYDPSFGFYISNSKAVSSANGTTIERGGIFYDEKANPI